VVATPVAAACRGCKWILPQRIPTPTPTPAPTPTPTSPLAIGDGRHLALIAQTEGEQETTGKPSGWGVCSRTGWMGRVFTHRVASSLAFETRTQMLLNWIYNGKCILPAELAQRGSAHRLVLGLASTQGRCLSCIGLLLVMPFRVLLFCRQRGALDPVIYYQCCPELLDSPSPRNATAARS
jgi:hypothetical protein